MSYGREHRIPADELMQPPKPANSQIVSSIAQQGIIGKCLYGALQDIIQKDDNENHDMQQEQEDNTSHHTDHQQQQQQQQEEESQATSYNAHTSSSSSQEKKQLLKLNQHMADAVMKEFGQAVVRTKWRNSTTENTEQKQPSKGKRNSSTSSLTTSIQQEQKKSILLPPPAALLRGRVHHFNRINSNWRIVIHKAQLKRRTVLDSRRKKFVKRLLWDAVDSPQVAEIPETTTSNSNSKSKSHNNNNHKNSKSTSTSNCISSLQLLAYDDII